MAIARFKALELAQSRQPVFVKIPTEKVTDYYGSNTFNDEVMRSLLSPEAYTKISNAIEDNKKIDREAADEVAAAMKSWALSKGATHYTHWFQPLTGTTAEKHDAFFDITNKGKAVEKFKNDHIPDMNKFPGRYMILVIDFDKYDDRAEKIQNFDIPDTLRDRVFIIGSRTNPQSLKKELKMNGEEIGEAIARSCAEKTGTIWDHPLLKHNQAEIDRLRPVIEQFRL